MDEFESSAMGADSSMQAGGSIPGSGEAAFRLWIPSVPSVPVLVAAPHAGRSYPAALLERMREPEQTRIRLEDRHVDRLACQVALATGAPLLVADAPRALIDLNRAPDDVDWSMVHGERAPRQRHSSANRRARSGLGIVPRRLPGLGEMWKSPISRPELESRIESVHRPYHLALGNTLEWLRDRWGAALLIDLHSMPPLRRRFPEEIPAEFVVGDRFGASCDARLARRALDYFATMGRSTAHNRPYSGGYVLERHSAPVRGLHAIQIEVCRSTYLDGRLDEPSARLSAVARLLSGLVRDLADGVAQLDREHRLSQAAE